MLYIYLFAICIFLIVFLGVVIEAGKQEIPESEWRLLGTKVGTHKNLREPISYWVSSSGHFRISINEANLNGLLPKQLIDTDDKEILEYLIVNFTPWVNDGTK
jgi:hypothetical protein